jgi:hypothetical protein
MTTRPAFAPALALILGSLLAPLAAPVASQTPPAATALFNGRDFAGWKMDRTGDWQVVDGAIVYAGKTGAALTTERAFGDFELTAEYHTNPIARASILLRDAALFSLAGSPGTPAWVPISFTLVGERVTLTNRGFTVVKHTRAPNARNAGQPLPPSGPLVFTAAGPFKLRNVMIREIGGAEANAILAKHDAARFTPIFDGKTFSGWTGPIDNYQIVDGALFCKPGSGGTIYTKHEYRDFAVRLEIQLPPGGNNGLAIRYPGKGDTAYIGMTELQVLDNTAEKYATLDPRQFHGSAYGMVPAHKGYQRPVGEWNFQEVTVRGSKIVVELNGTRILDADLSTVKTFMADSAHPGKDRASGHFGFAGHGDPVRFRNVELKPL